MARLVGVIAIFLSLIVTGKVISQTVKKARKWDAHEKAQQKSTA